MQFYLLCALLLIYLTSVYCVKTYSKEEQEAIKKLRSMIGNGDPFGSEYRDYMRKDEYLVRYVWDRNYDLEAAKQKFISMLKWRKENKIEGLENEKMGDMHKLFPYEIGAGVDKEGKPIMTVPFGPKWDLRRFIVRGDGRNRLARYSAQLLETGATTVRSLSKQSAVVLLDMTNYNARQHGCAACIPFYIDLMTQYERYYPVYVKNFYFINTPRIWETVSKILLPILSPITNNVIQIFGYNKREWQDELLKNINPDQLTAQYGGTRQH